jgi:hypothetical protein
MGLPAQWNDPQHGLCFTLWAAIDYLKKRGATCTNEGKILIYQLPGYDLQRIEPVHIAAMGWMYPQTELDK